MNELLLFSALVVGTVESRRYPAGDAMSDFLLFLAPLIGVLVGAVIMVLLAKWWTGVSWRELLLEWDEDDHY